jgi:hypothetical protein
VKGAKTNKTALHVVFDCEVLAVLRFCHLELYVIKPNDYENVPLSKVLDFV